MVYFLQGTSQLDNTGNFTIFNGVTFTSGANLLTIIRDALINPAAGWTEISLIGDTLKMQGSDNGQDCYVNFIVETLSGNAFNLKVQGDIDGTGRTKNTDSVGDPGDERLAVVECRNNVDQFYMVATAGSFCLGSFGQTSDSIPIFGGFFAGRDITDAGAWGFGKLDHKMGGKYLAGNKFISGDWYSFADYYYSTEGLEPAVIDETSQGFYHLTTDPTVNTSAATQTNDVSQSAYNPEKGAADPDGNAVIAPFFLKAEQYLQGSYLHLTGEGTGGYILGKIENAAVGMASFAQGSQSVVRGQRVIETSPSVYELLYFQETWITGTIGTQAFLIDFQTSTMPFT